MADENLIGPPLDIPSANPDTSDGKPPGESSPPTWGLPSAIPTDQGGNLIFGPDGLTYGKVDGQLCFAEDVITCEMIQQTPIFNQEVFNQDIIDGLIDLISSTSNIQVKVLANINENLTQLNTNFTANALTITQSLQNQLNKVEQKVSEIENKILLEIQTQLAPYISNINELEQQLDVNVNQVTNVETTTPQITFVPQVTVTPVTPIKVDAPGQPVVNVSVTIPKDAIKVEVNCDEKPDPVDLDKPALPDKGLDSVETLPKEGPDETGIDPEGPCFDGTIKGLTADLFQITSDCGIEELSSFIDKQGMTALTNSEVKTVQDAVRFVQTKVQKHVVNPFVDDELPSLIGPPLLLG